MNLFEQVKPEELKKEPQKKIKKEINKIKEIKTEPKKKRRGRPKKKKEESKSSQPAQTQEQTDFNGLELVGEIKEENKTHKAEVEPQPYVFSSYKNNTYSLLINCNKFTGQKPYFEFAKEKNLFLSNDNFNDFFDVKGNKLILNIEDFSVISYIIKNFWEDLENIKYVFNFNRNIPKEFFLDDFETKEQKCMICPFFNFKDKKCTL